MSKPMEIDVFWSFRSPWSYLATKRLRNWQEQYDLQVNFRAVYPIAVRMPEFFDQVQSQWFSYFAIDVLRVAEFLDLPLRQRGRIPSYNWSIRMAGARPVRSNLIFTGLPSLAFWRRKWGARIEFADEVSSLIWAETKGWDQGELLADVTHRAGLNLAEMDQRVVAESDRLSR